MNEELNKELSDILAAYLAGWKTLLDCYMWLASVDWDDPTLEADGQKVLGTFELLSTDVLEGFRDEAEFAQEASDFVAKETGSRYVIPRSQAVLVSSTSSSDNVFSNPLLITTASTVEQSWNISPLSATA